MYIYIYIYPQGRRMGLEVGRILGKQRSALRINIYFFCHFMKIASFDIFQIFENGHEMSFQWSKTGFDTTVLHCSASACTWL